MLKIDRIDVDQLERIRETRVWLDFEKRIRERRDLNVRTCMSTTASPKDIRLAQGAVDSLNFVLALPDLIQKEIVRRSADAG